MHEQRPRGLLSVHETRTKRKARKFPIIAPRVILWITMIFVAFGLLYYKRAKAELESEKAKLFERQRGIAAQIGPSFEPLRDRIEGFTTGVGAEYEGDFVDEAAPTLDLMGRAGVYLRLRARDAGSVETIRRAANDSLRDGFTSCFFRIPNADPTSGPECEFTKDCEAGMFCNEHDRCAPATQPYNMRAIYRGTRVLMDEWTVDLRTTTNDLRLRLLDRELDAVTAQDVPLAVDALARAEFFLLVVDEDPEGALGEGEGADAETIQGLPHPARVYLYGLRAPHHRLLLRLRRDVDARMLSAGKGAHPLSEEIIAARQRQANGCQLALQVKSALGEE